MADPTDECYCAEIPRDEDPPWSDNAPPEYAAEQYDGGPSAPLYAPEPVVPSRGGASTKGGPLVFPR